MDRDEWIDLIESLKNELKTELIEAVGQLIDLKDDERLIIHVDHHGFIDREVCHRSTTSAACYCGTAVKIFELMNTSCIPNDVDRFVEENIKCATESLC